MAIIYPSLMSADPLNLEQEINILDPHVIGYHVDIMDNHFVPNLAFNFDTIHAISRITEKQLWLHAMVDNPTSIIDKLTLPEKTIYTFHIESHFSKNDIMKKLSEKKWLASIAIKPKTDVTQLFDFIDAQTYQVLVMAVNPGFAGQQFMPSTLEKIKQLQEFRTNHGFNFTIGIDGGINEKNIAEVAKYDIDQMAIASAIFGNTDRVEALRGLKKHRA